MKLFGRFNLKLLFLVSILVLAGFLRLWQLGTIPVGFTPDEASFGYDAYSIMKTGRDQWGRFLPVTLESFGDFKSPLYTYLAVPSVFLFGLTEFAVRLPNALAGTLAVFVLYLLLGEIGKLSKLEEKRILLLQRSGALLLSISSWHVMMSRGAFEANLVTLFIPLGIYFFLKGLESPKYYIFSALSFGLGLFTYHSAKLLIPVIFVGLILVFRKTVAANWKRFAVPVVIFLLFFSVLLYTFKVGSGTRIVERSITQGALEEGAKIKIQLIQDGMNPVLAKLLHNKYQVTASRFVSNYSQYFSFRFLFLKGPAETTYGMIPGIGVIYIFEGLLILGLIPLINKRRGVAKTIGIVALWLLLTPLPAALATGVGFAANRAEGMIPALQILAAFGLVGWNLYFEKMNRNVLMAVSAILGIVAAANLAPVWKEYFINSPNTSAQGMLYGRGEAIRYAFENQDAFNTIVISRTLSEPQIYAAFYTKYDPVLFQKESVNWAVYKEKKLSFLDQLGEYHLGNYVFRNIDYKKDSVIPGILLMGKPEEFADGINVVKEIKYPDGSPSIYIVKP